MNKTILSLIPDITLMRNYKVVNEQVPVSNILNSFFTIAETTGNTDSIDVHHLMTYLKHSHNNHDSVRYIKIKDNLFSNNEVTFSSATTE